MNRSCYKSMLSVLRDRYQLFIILLIQSYIIIIVSLCPNSMCSSSKNVSLSELNLLIHVNIDLKHIYIVCH